MLDVRSDKQWLTAAEAAAERLPGFEYDERHIRRLITSGELRGCKRNGRGGGRAFPYTELPAESRAEYLKRYGVQTADAESAIRDPLFLAEVRAAIVVACQAFVAHHNLPVGKGVMQFVKAYLKRQASLRIETWVYEAAPQLTPRALADWRAKFERGGTKALLDARGRPQGSSWIEDDEPLKRFIVATIAARPHLSAVAINAAIATDLQRTDVPLRTLQAFLASLKKNNRAVVKALTDPDRARSHHKPAFGSRSMNVTRINQLWEIDATRADVMCLVNGAQKRCALTALIDVFTRRARVVVSDQPRGLATQALLRRAILDFGLPETLKADNGREYKNRAVERFCRDTGITLDFSRPFSPEEKGHIERFFKTLLHSPVMESLPGYVAHDIAGRKAIENRRSFSHRFGTEAQLVIETSLSPVALQARLDAWLANIYEQTVHASLGVTPAAKAIAHEAAAHRLVNGSVRALDVLLFDVKGGHGIRVVGKRGVRVDSILYVAPELGGISGRHVHVKVDPTDPSRAVIYLVGRAGTEEFVCVAIDANSLEGHERAKVARAAIANFNALTSRVRADAKSIHRIHPPHGLADRMLRLVADNGSRGDAESRSTGYLESTDSPGTRSTLAEKVASPPGQSSDGGRQRRNDAASHVKGLARDALRASASPRDIELSLESARAMFDASRPALIEHEKAQAAIEKSKSVPQPIPLTEDDHAGALAFIESVTPRRVEQMTPCDGYERPFFSDDDGTALIDWWDEFERAGGQLDDEDQKLRTEMLSNETFKLLLKIHRERKTRLSA